ncbi:MAG: SRPBCC domain-containing protein [Caulobacter sp.]|nr:SRPBCC domain-containing protein [Caulobacter sp.]
MTDTPADLGQIARLGDQVQVTLTRRFDHAVATVWTLLTDPARLPEWLAPGEIELHPGGRARLDFVDSGTMIDSVVSAFKPGALLEYSWSEPGEPPRPVRWELQADGPAATRLTLTLTTPAAEDAGRAAAGWEAHLEMLAAALEDVPIKFPFERFKAARDAYRALLA